MNGMGGMPPGMSPQLMQAMMSDPELMRIMQRPDVMAKLQQIMANPSSAPMHMNDPDIQYIMSRLQSLTGNGAGGGMQMPPPAQPMPNPFGSNASSSSSSSDGSVIEISSTSHFNQMLSGANGKLVVVDWSAEWCGPCKMIAPRVKEMATLYAGRALFLKVDVDRVRDLAQAKGIRSMPTFHFYKDSALIEEFSGADDRRLGQLVEQHAPLSASGGDQVTQASPYSNFPLRQDEMCSFKPLKGQVVMSKIAEFNGQVPEPDRIVPEDLDALNQIVELIEKRENHHRTKVEEQQMKLIFQNEIVKKWSSEKLPPFLNVIRAGVLHPNIVQQLSGALTTPPKTGITIQSIIKQLVPFLNNAQQAPINALTVLRTFCNLSSRRSLSQYMVLESELVFESALACVKCSTKSVRLSLVSLLINYAIIYSRGEHRDNGDVVASKVHCLSLVVELLKVCTTETDPDGKLALRSLIVLGSLLYRDDTTKSLAKNIEVASVLEMLPKLDENVKKAIHEVRQCLNGTE